MNSDGPSAVGPAKPRVAPIARLSGCRKHRRGMHNVKNLVRLRRPDRQPIGATRGRRKAERSTAGRSRGVAAATSIPNV